MAESDDEISFEDTSEDTIQEEAIPEEEAIAIPEDDTIQEEEEPEEIVNIFDSPNMYATPGAQQPGPTPTIEDKVFGMFRKKKPGQPVPGQQPMRQAAQATGETTAQMIARIKNQGQAPPRAAAPPRTPAPAPGSAKRQQGPAPLKNVQAPGPSKIKGPEISYVNIAKNKSTDGPHVNVIKNMTPPGSAKNDISTKQIPTWDIPETKPKKNYIRPLVTLFALVILAAGGYAIFSELPSHPLLVIGIIMCSAGAGLVMGNTV